MGFEQSPDQHDRQQTNSGSGWCSGSRLPSPLSTPPTSTARMTTGNAVFLVAPRSPTGNRDLAELLAMGNMTHDTMVSVELVCGRLLDCYQISGRAARYLADNYSHDRRLELIIQPSADSLPRPFRMDEHAKYLPPAEPPSALTDDLRVAPPPPPTPVTRRYYLSPSNPVANEQATQYLETCGLPVDLTENLPTTTGPRHCYEIPEYTAAFLTCDGCREPTVGLDVLVRDHPNEPAEPYDLKQHGALNPREPSC